MRKNEIICAFYNPEVERFDKYHSFMKVVVENQKRIAPLYFENNDGKYLIVFYRRKLKKLIKLLQDEALDFYEYPNLLEYQKGQICAMQAFRDMQH